jgi:hypothetical protein
MPPQEVVTFLNGLFTRFDVAAQDLGIEKIRRWATGEPLAKGNLLPSSGRSATHSDRTFATPSAGGARWCCGEHGQRQECLCHQGIRKIDEERSRQGDQQNAFGAGP